MHVLLLKCGITGRRSSKNSFHTHFWHFSMRKPSMRKPDKAADVRNSLIELIENNKINHPTQ
jgi:hypothetical protein